MLLRHRFIALQVETGGNSMTIELLEAVKGGDVNHIRQIIVAGADANYRDSDGATMLMLAAHTGNLQMVAALITAGAEVNASDERGWTALMNAVYNAELDKGFADVAQALIDAGANVEAAIGYGIRPLMLAAGYGETAVCETLLKAGADVMARNEGGLTALMMVKQKHYVDVINLLHEAERDAGVGEGSCTSKNEPGSKVITFLKPIKKS